VSGQQEEKRPLSLSVRVKYCTDAKFEQLGEYWETQSSDIFSFSNNEKVKQSYSDWHAGRINYKF
jgi:hypothetical protein